MATVTETMLKIKTKIVKIANFLIILPPFLSKEVLNRKIPFHLVLQRFKYNEIQKMSSEISAPNRYLGNRLCE